MSQKLSENDLRNSLQALPEWQFQGGELVRTVAFQDFEHAIAFVNAVAVLAETAGHHPDIDIRYSKVRLALVTHDAGGVTENDTRLAHDIDQELEK